MVWKHILGVTGALWSIPNEYLLFFRRAIAEREREIELNY